MYYFSIPFWRAEVTRISLFINNIDFADYRISEKEYLEFKKKGKLPNGKIAPFRQLPVLEIDGKIIGQPCAIARFCGKISGMYPTNNDINAGKIDQILDAAQDINYIITLNTLVFIMPKFYAIDINLVIALNFSQFYFLI